MNAYSRSCSELRAEPRTWLITGVAGFIGSHLLETLLSLDQRVVGIDNFCTGTPANLDEVRTHVRPEQWERFSFLDGSITDMSLCRRACEQVDYVLHHAGFVSVPLSIEDPVACHDTNVTGTLNLLVAARDKRVRRFVYASSSAVYGDDPRMPKIEAQIGNPLSPYGASKLMDEFYANLFYAHYGLECMGLRYFNVFGSRQNPTGGYAAVIPQWIGKLVTGGQCLIHGDGTATRDYCHVSNVVQANILGATSGNRAALGEVFNVALGGSTDLNTLYAILSEKLAVDGLCPRKPVAFGPPRVGDIQHSSADISKITERLEFAPEISLDVGLEQTVRWYGLHYGLTAS